jgi:hypothetical protein
MVSPNAALVKVPALGETPTGCGWHVDEFRVATVMDSIARAESDAIADAPENHRSLEVRRTRGTIPARDPGSVPDRSSVEETWSEAMRCAGSLPIVDVAAGMDDALGADAIERAHSTAIAMQRYPFRIPS